MVNEILAIIKEIEDIIFLYNLREINSRISRLGEKLSLEVSHMDPNNIRSLNEILNIINIAMNNKDYLLLADILEYELCPLLGNYTNKSGGRQ